MKNTITNTNATKPVSHEWAVVADGRLVAWCRDASDADAHIASHGGYRAAAAEFAFERDDLHPRVGEDVRIDAGAVLRA